MNVMICDDAGFIRTILNEKCAELGHTVLGSVASTRELREELQKKIPDVVFLDIVLPDEDGLSFLRSELSARDALPSVTYVLVSSLGGGFFQEKLEALVRDVSYPGEIYFLNKPFSVADLKEILDSIRLKKRKAG